MEHRGPSTNGLKGDALAVMLRALRPEAWTLGVFDLHQSVGVRFTSGHASLFYVITGTLRLRPSIGATPIEVSSGELVLFVGGDEPVVADRDSSRVHPMSDVLSRSHVLRPSSVPIGRGPIRAQFIGVAIRFGIDAPARVVESLPDTIRLGIGEHSEACSGLLTQLADSARRGNTRIADAIASVIVLDILHQHFETKPGHQGLVGMAYDPHIGPLLALIQEHPSRPWTVESMQMESGLSRTPFFDRFRGLTGCSPTTYLRDVRVNLAKRLLTTTEMTISQIANSTGYQSSGALCSAFKGCTGLTPSQFRKIDDDEGTAPPFPKST
jgi:AraC-like DNA-binding protein